MKKSLTRVLLACLLVLTVVFACGCSNTPDPSASNWKVTFYEGDGTTVLQDGSLDYSARWRIITVMNTVISMDSNINSIELFNMAENEVLIAERSGARVDESGERLTQWE